MFLFYSYKNLNNYSNKYLDILTQVCESWKRFSKGKMKSKDLIVFWYDLEINLLNIVDDLYDMKYKHGNYQEFKVFDNKKRTINKSCVRDRVVHEFVRKYLVEIFEEEFIENTFASIPFRGTHLAVQTFQKQMKDHKTKNRQTFILSADIRKYFDNIDHDTLFKVIKDKIEDKLILFLVEEIIISYHKKAGKGIPLGNSVSQIFANIYLDSLDKYITLDLKIKEYVRYNDDIRMIFNNQDEALKNFYKIKNFLDKNLKLELPESKMNIRKERWGIDFLGYRVFNNFILIRRNTKNKIFKRINNKNKSSYLGILKIANSYNLKSKIKYRLYKNRD